LPDVDLWDESRDARLYKGPYPVVAHPPCARWCKLAGLVEARYGYKKGDDGGCFKAALDAVRAYGGVLEHPAFSDAWPAFDLMQPLPNVWSRCIDGGWVVELNQIEFDHPARKKTWLYAFGATKLPMFRTTTRRAIATVGTGQIGIYRPVAMVGRTWVKEAQPTARVSFLRNQDAVPSTLRRLSSKEASSTPPAFRDVLLSIARSVVPTA